METVLLFADIISAYFIDLVAGDPHWLPHPVRFIGWLIKKYESLLRGLINNRYGEQTEKKERIAGGFLMLMVTATTALLVFLILYLARGIHPIAFHIVNIYFIYTSLATKCLATEAEKVYSVLAAGDLDEARKRLSMLVGRQTDKLDSREVAKAVVETTAENTVDGIISPLFYAFIGSILGLGAPFAYAFKAISTLDSMVGYKNEKYINFGRISAKTDDAANFLPARLSGVLIPFAALLCGFDMHKSFSIMLRDRHNHKSPNCAYPEAAFAGALGIKLGGTNIYFGKPVEKPDIGNDDKEIVSEDIKSSIKLMYVTSALTLTLVIVLTIIIFLVLRF